MSDVRRFDLKQCTACKGTGKGTIYKEATWEEVTCLTCLGEGYVRLTSEEELPDLSRLSNALDALAELKRERQDSQSFLQSLAIRDQDVARLESELAAARAEIARLRDGIEAIRKDAAHSALYSKFSTSKTYGELSNAIRRLLENKD